MPSMRFLFYFGPVKEKTQGRDSQLGASKPTPNYTQGKTERKAAFHKTLRLGEGGVVHYHLSLLLRVCAFHRIFLFKFVMSLFPGPDSGQKISMMQEIVRRCDLFCPLLKPSKSTHSHWKCVVKI